MIICKSPYRISLFGGGSDHPEFIKRHGYAFCINVAIDLHNYVCVKKLSGFHNYRSKITYDKIERVNKNSEISHRVFRECISFAGLQDESLEINFISDLPGIGLGVGSSSSMIVNLLYALDYYKLYECGIDRKYDEYYNNPDDIWKDAIHVERDILGESVGYQDAWAAVHGGLKSYKYNGEKLIVRDFPIGLYKLIDSYGMLFYTGNYRKSTDIINTYIDDNAFFDKQLEMRNIAVNAFFAKDVLPYSLPALGNYINTSWILKKSINPSISSDRIDYLIDLCNQYGYCSRLLGAGGGGCIFSLVDRDKQSSLVHKMKEQGCIHIPFKIDLSGVRKVLND